MIETLKVVMKIIVVTFVGFLLVAWLVTLWKPAAPLPSNPSLRVTKAETSGAEHVLLIYDSDTGTRCYAIERAITCVPGTPIANAENDWHWNPQIGKYESSSGKHDWFIENAPPPGYVEVPAPRWNIRTLKCEPDGTKWNPQTAQCEYAAAKK